MTRFVCPTVSNSVLPEIAKPNPAISNEAVELTVQVTFAPVPPAVLNVITGTSLILKSCPAVISDTAVIPPVLFVVTLALALIPRVAVKIRAVSYTHLTLPTKA